MPLYDFRCGACDARFEARTGSDDPPPPCPSCGATEVTRVLTGFGLISSPMPRGYAAKRSDATRRVREEQRAERKAERKAQRENG